MLYIDRGALHNASASKLFVITSYVRLLQKSVRQRHATVPGVASLKALKANRRHVLRNKEYQNGVVNISRVRVMQLTPELGGTILCFGMG